MAWSGGRRPFRGNTLPQGILTTVCLGIELCHADHLPKSLREIASRKTDSQRMKRLRYWIEWFLVSLFGRLIRSLPFTAVQKLGDLAGSLVFWGDSKDGP